MKQAFLRRQGCHKNIEFSDQVPSREQILSLLRKSHKSTSLKQLIKHFALIDEQAQQGLKARLEAMQKDGLVQQASRVSWKAHLSDHLVTGTVIGHRDGYGFIQRDDGEEDLYLSQHEMIKVMNGDRVRVRLKKRSKGWEASIVEVIAYQHTRLVGRLLSNGTHFFVAPEDQRIQQEIYIAHQDLLGAKLGQVVVVEVLRRPSRQAHAQGRIVEVLGEIDDPGMEIEIAVRKFNLPFEFAQAALKEADALPDKVSAQEIIGRVDLRDVPFITIDGEDARDFDDAVYAQSTTFEGKPAWRLLVAIADVAHYVKPDSALDEQAQLRSTSVYFPRKVIPMLPEKLSNGLCSLNPKVDRLTMVCDMVIGAEQAQAGQVLAYQFFEGVIHSHARTTYQQIWSALDKPKGKEAKQLAELYPHVQDLYALFHVLTQARSQRGAMDLDTVETQIICDELGKIKEIKPLVRNDAHRLIEECMLAANTCAADFILRKKQTTVFRIHEGPRAEKLSNLREFLKPLGLYLGGGEQPTSQDYARLLDQARTRPDFSIIQTLCLRSMQQAVYSPDNEGHFGLAYEAYAHFTSPIRRYPDLLTHRVIKSILSKKRYLPELAEVPRLKGEPLKEHTHAVWEYIGRHTSSLERRADEASYDVQAWLKCWYMRDKVGEVFTGKVSAVTAFGLFVVLDGYYVEGLIHISALGEDFFQFHEQTHSLLGERTGIRYGIGDTVTVKIMRVDVESRRIELGLVRGKSQAKRMAKKVAVSTKKRLSKGSKGSSKSGVRKTSSKKPQSSKRVKK